MSASTDRFVDSYALSPMERTPMHLSHVAVGTVLFSICTDFPRPQQR